MYILLIPAIPLYCIKILLIFIPDLKIVFSNNIANEDKLFLTTYFKTSNMLPISFPKLGSIEECNLHTACLLQSG